MTDHTLPRRDFLKTGALAGSLLILPRGLRGAGGISPNGKINIALVGVGGRGGAALQALQEENFVAFCDVDDVRGHADVYASKEVGPIVRTFPDAKWFKDYRVMFDEMAEKIDAVAVCTPDHTHFPIAMAAIAQGKPVFVEKPLCRCISEVRALHLAAGEAGLVTQMGNQGRAAEGIRIAREWVQAGLIGDVHTVHTYTDRPRLPWFLDPAFDPDENAAEEPIPDTLDWALWLGPSPMRTYRSAFVPRLWRGFVDYGCGSLGDMGCHQIDAAFYALDLGAPISVEAATTRLYPKTFPKSVAVTYKFPARGNMSPVEMKWFDGGLQPPRPPEVPPAEWNIPDGGGSVFYGTKGSMFVTSHSGSCRLMPEARMRAMASSLPPKIIPRVKGGPHVEWANAIRGGPACGSQFDYSAPLTETVLLGIAAIRAQSRIEWDRRATKITNLAAANRFIGPGYEYRSGWGV